MYIYIYIYTYIYLFIYLYVYIYKQYRLGKHPRLELPLFGHLK